MEVQRAWAIVVLIVIGFSPIAPAFAYGSDAIQLPPCCRVHGKHKCAAGSGPVSSPVFDSNTSNTAPRMYSLCDQFPLLQLASSTPVSPATFLPQAAQVLFAGVFSHPASQEQTEARFRISFARSRQKRGPPAFLS